MSDILAISKKESKNVKFKKIKKPNFWTEEEDQILKEKAQEYNFKNWRKIANFIPGRTSIQCSARYRRIRPGLNKGSWNKEEDEQLLLLFQKYGKNWAAISKEMPHRTGKQIRDRFLNSLDSKFVRGKFTQEEDQIIIKYYKIYGHSWAKIAKKLKTRTGDMVKNRFYSSLKKIVSRNKNILRKKREGFLTFSPKKKIKLDDKDESKNNKITSFVQNDANNINNPSNEKKEEEKEISNSSEDMKEIKQDHCFELLNEKEMNKDDQNYIIIKKDSIEESNNFDKSDKIIDYCEKENIKKNTVNNFQFLNSDENFIKNENLNEIELNDNNQYNSDLFSIFNNNVNNINIYELYQKDNIEEILNKYKNGPKLELEYNQNKIKQIGKLFDVENILNQKIFSIQKYIENS
jgi:hypothetical protein